MDLARSLTDTTPQIHGPKHLRDQLSSGERLALIMFCLAAGLSIAYFQVVSGRNGTLKLHDPPSRAVQILRTVRLITLNAISGALLMMATSIEDYDAGLTTLQSDVHTILDPHATRIRINCVRVHVLHWIQYSIGWQMLNNLLQHMHDLHLWVLPLEIIVALASFTFLVLVEKREMKRKAALMLSAYGHCACPSYWLVWISFAISFILHLQEFKTNKPPLLPLFEHEGRKVSQPLQDNSERNTTIRRHVTTGVGLYLLSVNLYSHGAKNIELHTASN